MKNLFAAIMFLTSAMAAADDTPRVEFVFEERVTLSPAVVIGDTAIGYRQIIPITGGTVTGPKFKGVVLPGGRDLQLTYSASQCTQLSADYFIKSEDGTVVHVFNEGLWCPGTERAIFRPRLEAPKGPHEWMTRATFVATLEVEPPENNAVRIRIYQVK
jgi:hypothetical protein